MRPAWALVPLLLAAACGGGGGAAGSAPSAPAAGPAGTGIALRPLVNGLDQPVDVVPVPGSGDLAIVEKTGVVRIWRHGRLLPRPLLDFTGHVSTSSEQGLLSIAFSTPLWRGRLAPTSTSPTLPVTPTWPRSTPTAGRCARSCSCTSPTPTTTAARSRSDPTACSTSASATVAARATRGHGQNRGSLLAKLLRLDVSLAAVAAADLRGRAAQPLAVLVRPGHGRPLHRRRRPSGAGGGQRPAGRE